MSQTETLLIAGDGEAATAAAALCAAEGIRASVVGAHAEAFTPIDALAGELAPAVEQQPSEWILYLRSGEFLTRGLLDELAGELSRDTQRAYAFRLRRRLFEGPLPLILDDPVSRDGEIRLLFRRRARYRRDGTLVNSGTVLRLAEMVHVDVHRSGLVEKRNEVARLSGVPLLLRRPALLFHPPSASFVVRHPDEVRSWLSGRRPGRGPEHR